MKRLFPLMLALALVLGLLTCFSEEPKIDDPEVNMQIDNTTLFTESGNTAITPQTTAHTHSQSEQEANTVDPTEAITYDSYWVTASVVNFRRAPSTQGELICQLEKGTEIKKIDEVGDWIYICHGETHGYIHGDYAAKYPPLDSKDGEVYIIVKKSERLLELWQGENKVVSFSVGLGWEPEGHKQVEGDGRTPEGEYYVCVRNSNSSFYLSLGISYPNKEDAAKALEDGRIDSNTYKRIANAIDQGRCPDWYTALGGEIMIHGCGGSSDWTAGCIAVDNDVMDYLFDCCPVGTRITILP